MKKNVPLDISYRLINHGPVVLVSTLYRGRPNVCAAAWVTPVDLSLVLVVISRENYTARCIHSTGEFVINVPNQTLRQKVVSCGSVSGECVDKFAKFGLTPEKARKVGAPLVRECIGHLECRVIKGEERLARKYDIFLARVVAASAERGLFTTHWLPRRSAARTLHHLGGKIFAVLSGKMLG